MSLTIRMRRALAAFRADPSSTLILGCDLRPKSPTHLEIVKDGKVGGRVAYASRTQEVDTSLRELAAVLMKDSTDWKIHSAYHRSRVIHGKRLNWHTNGKGNQSAQYGTTMYYGSNVRHLFRALGLKDTW